MDVLKNYNIKYLLRNLINKNNYKNNKQILYK